MKNYIMNSKSQLRAGNTVKIWLVSGIVLLLASACKHTEDEVTPTTDVTVAENQKVNDWILENMQDYYYWNDKLPSNPDKTQAPSDFFDSILYTYDATTNPNGDRFSWIQESADELEASLSGETTTTGMEYNLYLRASGSTGVIAQVLYVLPNSPAEKAGIKRGDIIAKVNGQLLTTDNYASLLFTGTTFTFGFATFNGSALTDTDRSVSVTATVYQENPVFMDSVYTYGSKKIGYLVYNQFVPGANNSTAGEYDAQVDAIFSFFKNQGVNELVLDLRYNPGGYTSSSANLASLIGKGISTSSVYFKEEWNSILTPYLTQEYGSGFFVQNFVSKAQNIGANLQRVFVLTTDHTASASELIINGLKPYMQVITIGTTTYGKNVGSITITDKTGAIKWGMQPIVFKSFNSLGQSDYSTGFVPNIEVEEPAVLQPLGSVQEDLLNEALYQITGSSVNARRAVKSGNQLTLLNSSILRKAGGGRMIKTLKTLQW
jgi:C-terminal processing protease CtpA/Prc